MKEIIEHNGKTYLHVHTLPLGKHKEIRIYIAQDTSESICRTYKDGQPLDGTGIGGM